MAFDLIVLAILLTSAVIAFLRGFVKEVLAIVGLVGAGVAALYGGPVLAPTTQSWLVDPAATEPQKLFDIIPYTMVGTALAYVLLFVVTLVALSIAAHWIAKMVHHVGLGPVDRSLGVVFGLVRGFILVGLLYLPFHILLTDDQKQAIAGPSKTLPYVTYTSELMQALLPGKHVGGLLGKDNDKPTPETASAAGTTDLGDPLKGLTGDTPPAP